MPPRPPTPRKESLVELFDAARRRLIRETGDIALLPNKRIVGATKELKSIVDDIRGAQLPPKSAARGQGERADIASQHGGQDSALVETLQVTNVVLAGLGFSRRKQ